MATSRKYDEELFPSSISADFEGDGGNKLAKMLRDCAYVVEKNEFDPIIYQVIGLLHSYAGQAYERSKGNSSGSTSRVGTTTEQHKKESNGTSNKEHQPFKIGSKEKSDDVCEEHHTKKKPSFQRSPNPNSNLLATGWIEQQRRSKMRIVWKEVLASLVEGRRSSKEETTLWIQRQIHNPSTQKNELEALHQIPLKWVEDISYLDFYGDFRFSIKVYNFPDEFHFRCQDEDSASQWIKILRMAREAALFGRQMNLDDSDSANMSAANSKKTVKELRAIAHGAGIETRGMERADLERVIFEISKNDKLKRNDVNNKKPEKDMKWRQKEILEERRRQEEKQREEEDRKKKLAEQMRQEEIRFQEEQLKRQQEQATRTEEVQRQQEQLKRQQEATEQLKRQQEAAEQLKRQQEAAEQLKRQQEAAEQLKRQQQWQQQNQWQNSQQNQGNNRQYHRSQSFKKYMNETSEEQQAVAITAIKRNVLITWALQPPMLQTLRPIDQLILSIHQVLPPAFGLPSHEYFSKFKPFVKQDIQISDVMTGVSEEKLKKAVRRVRVFLHPDRLPKELNSEQQFLCKMLWDVTSDGWEVFCTKNEELDWVKS